MRHPLGALSAVRQAGANRRVQGRRGEAGELSASSRAGLLPLLPPLFDGSAFRFVGRDPLVDPPSSVPSPLRRPRILRHPRASGDLVASGQEERSTRFPLSRE